ncbi:MAG: endolytic transglycosylase MltG [Gemmatimonadota bacterium]
MTRRGRRGTDGAQDEEGFWLPEDGGPEDSGAEGGYQETGRRRRPPEPSGPPWETGGWQADQGWTGTGPADTGWQGHPSGPLPPLPETGGWPAQETPGGWEDERYPAEGSGSYPAGAYGSGSYPAGEYPSGGYPADSGAFPSGEYRTGGFPAAGDYPSGGFAAPGTGGYPAGDYPTGGYQAADYAGSGFGEPRHQGDYAGQEYEDGPGYPGAGGQYQDEPPGAGYPGPDTGNHPRYPDRGDWYGDVDEQQPWAGEDEAGSGFLAGLDGEGDRGGRRREPARPGRGRPTGRAAKRKRGGMRKVMPRVFLSLLLLIVLAAGGGLYYVYRTYIHPADYSGPGTGSVVVHIPPGDTATAIGLLLQQKGVVASARAFGNAAKSSPQGSALEPGYYRLHKHMQASLALAMLLKPSSRMTFRAVIPEGYRLSQIIATLGKATGNLAGYQAAIKNTAALGLPPYAKGNPEGFLFPATYTIQPGTAPLAVLKQMVQRFGQEAATINLPAAARHAQLDNSLTAGEHDAIVVASLVQAEGGRVQDFPKIARVIYNRLNAGMELELDSTVMYALHTYGILATNTQLNAKSPYNTYRHLGLPPGPIDSPGDAAIQAALHPAQGTWLYFVTVNPKTGLTKFTSDPAVFAQLKAQLQKNLGQG